MSARRKGQTESDPGLTEAANYLSLVDSCRGLKSNAQMVKESQAKQKEIDQVFLVAEKVSTVLLK